MTSRLKFEYMTDMTEEERHALIAKETADEKLRLQYKQRGYLENNVIKLSSEQLKYQLNQIMQNDSELDTLNWSGQKMTDEIILKLAESLKDNTHCTTIDLENCQMTSASAPALATVLSSKKIGRLTLSGNPLGDQGLESILNTMMDSKVLWYRVEAKNVGATKASLIRTSHVIHMNHNIWEVQFKEDDFSPDDWMLYGQINEKFRKRRRTEIRNFQKHNHYSR